METLTEEGKEKIKEADKIIEEIDSVSYERVEMMRTKLEKCTSSVAEVNVNGSHRLHAREEALLLLAEMTQTLDDSLDKLKNLYKRIPKKDRNLRIYFDKVYFNLENRDLMRKYDLSKRHINRIVKEIKKNLKKTP